MTYHHISDMHHLISSTEQSAHDIFFRKLNLDAFPWRVNHLEQNSSHVSFRFAKCVRQKTTTSGSVPAASNDANVYRASIVTLNERKNYGFGGNVASHD